MRITLVIALLVAVAVAAPGGKKHIPITQYEEQHDDLGQFIVHFEDEAKTKVTQQGALKPTPDKKDHVLVFSGSHSYKSPEGIPITLTYTADENGYHPVGDHIPKV